MTLTAFKSTGQLLCRMFLNLIYRRYCHDYPSVTDFGKEYYVCEVLFLIMYSQGVNDIIGDEKCLLLILGSKLGLCNKRQMKIRKTKAYTFI